MDDDRVVWSGRTARRTRCNWSWLGSGTKIGKVHDVSSLLWSVHARPKPVGDGSAPLLLRPVQFRSGSTRLLCSAMPQSVRAQPLRPFSSLCNQFVPSPAMVAILLEPLLPPMRRSDLDPIHAIELGIR